MRRPEQELQIQIIDLFRKIGLDRHYKFFHVPNGGSRTQAEAGIFKAMGVLPGVADIQILPGPFFIEVKARGGRQTAEQISFQSWCRSNSIECEVVFDLDMVLELLHRWGLIRVGWLPGQAHLSYASGYAIKVLPYGR